MSITYNPTIQTFFLESKDTSYVFKTTPFGHLEHLYYGKRIALNDLSYSVINYDKGFAANFSDAPNRTISLDTMQNEYPEYGTGDYRESAIMILQPDGSRVTDFRYLKHEIVLKKPQLKSMPSVRGNQTLIITLADSEKKYAALLYYTVFEDLPIILRHVEIKNFSGQNIELLRAMSFCLDLYDRNYSTLDLHGRHCMEQQIQSAPAKFGKHEIYSARGASSHQHNPFMAIVGENTNEDLGEVFGFNLVYSGSFTLSADKDQTGNIRVLGGINPFDFSYIVKPCEIFETPECVLAFSNNGFNGMSQAFHDLYRNYLINPKFALAKRPIVANNWEATYMDFNTNKLFKLIDSVKNTGIDTFVLDDGWFGKRDDDNSGLGDWYVNTQKLKSGLNPIIARCKLNNLNFGLWFEPEMVSADSDLFRAHPDWVIRHPNRNPVLSRNQLVLDLTNKDALEYIKKSVYDILSCHDISYVKWDMNRHISDNFSLSLPPNQQRGLHHRYITAVYDLANFLTESFPNIFFEGCSGGGGRFDPAMLYYFPQYWASDNSDAYARTFIEYGTSYCYPLSSITNHISVCPNHQTGRVTPFKTRCHLALLSSCGYELDMSKLSNADIDTVRWQTSTYRNVEDLMLRGDFYRIVSPFKSGNFASITVAKDKSEALFLFIQGLSQANPILNRVRLKGLDENKNYFIKELNAVISGSVLMNVGITIPALWGDFESYVLNLQEHKKEVANDKI